MPKSIAKAQSMPALKQLQTVELKKRVLTSVDRYPGLKNSEEYVAARVGKARDKDRQAEKEYWAHLKKFKEEVKSVFKLPQDTYAGKRSVQEEINEKVEKGQRALQETDEAYQNWLKEMEKRQQERIQDKLQQRRNEIDDLNNRKLEMQAALQQELTDKAAGFKEKEKAYWNWLADAKQAVAARPGVAPLYKFDGKSVEELVAEKRAALSKEVTAREQEYRRWLESVSKPKFVLPSQQVNTPAQRAIIVQENVRKGLEKLNEKTAEYQKWLKEMEQQKHEKMMEKVKAKLNADREDIERREKAMNALEEKMAIVKAEEEMRAKLSKEELLQMYKEVHEKPLLIEQAYDYGRVFKKGHPLGKSQSGSLYGHGTSQKRYM
mmetsp:Transcript_68508/g.150682  ORF Transcript_68508/g.150682 Transcript_68508/m.150682 type:complete len:378 (-) Transcript_68508:47-1180(-)